MYEYSITIGRNVGSEPMELTEWQHFVYDVRSTAEWAQLTRELQTDVEVLRGIGRWDGVSEDTAKIVFRTDGALYPETLAQIRTELRDYCDRYRQDAIALSVGGSELVQRRQYTPMTGRW